MKQNLIMLKTFTVIFFSIIMLHTGGCSLEKNPRLISVDSHSLSMFSKGSGIPTIVIDVDFGDSYTNWLQIIDTLSLYTRVVAYDRAGYGESEEGPYPRDCQQEVTELNMMLERANAKKPYLLIGHSLGALNSQYYTHLFPSDVAGMLLLDPPPLNWINGKVKFPDIDSLAREQSESFSAMAELAKSSIDPEDELKSIYYETLASEHESMFSTSAEQIETIGTFYDLPITILAGGKPNPRFGNSAEIFQKFWINESRSIALKSTRGKFILLDESTHFIYLDFPYIVISEVKELLKEIRN